jgi:hypothetical protein
MAAVVVVHVVMLVWTVGTGFRDYPALTRPSLFLAALIGLQLVLGGGTWIAKYGWPSWFSNYAFAAGYTIVADGLAQTLTVTAHVATGSLILVTTVLLLLRSLRLVRPQTEVNSNHLILEMVA